MMKDEGQSEFLYWSDLTSEAQAVVLAEVERSGESVEEVINRYLIEAGRRRH
jgi:hypothetical protein